MFGILGVVSSINILSCFSFGARERGDGILATSERIVLPFEKISSGGSAEVRFHASQEYRIMVTADSNLAEYVTTDVRNNTLNTGTKRDNCSFTKFAVDVYCPFLTGVSISGSGSFTGNDKITATAFESAVSGAGKIEGAIECDTFSAKISGSGRVAVSGNCKDSNIGLSGSGDFYGNELSVNNAVFNIHGSGNANVNVTDSLKANIHGSGRLNYSGDPKTVESSVSGSGKINKQ